MAAGSIDWGALEGWALVAGLMLALVALVWWRQWRRDPQGFRERFRRLPHDWRGPSPPLPPRR